MTLCCHRLPRNLNRLQRGRNTVIIRLMQEKTPIAAAEEVEMSRTPLAFMSYVNLDDQHEQGRLTQFRERLSGEVRMQTGEPFDIFQDRQDIAWGQQWQERLDSSLAAVTFLLPIITPAFFKSDACRDELERFLKREKELGRGDLILPVYYVNCPVLSDKVKLELDPLAKIIAARQYADWRPLRFKPFDSEQVCETFAKMAQQIAVALERSEAESVRADAVRPALSAKEAEASKRDEKDSAASISQSNKFKTDSGEQSIAQGSNAIGTQINNYYAPPLQESKPQPTSAAKTEPPTVVVDRQGKGDYATITEAIKAAKLGTQILVRPGLYRESIVINKPVEIIGDGKRDDIVIEASGKPAVSFQADNGRIANLTLRQTGDGIWSGVDIAQGRLTLEDCDIFGQKWACVEIHGSADPTLRRNRIHDGQKAGVFVYDNGKGTLEDNEIFANKAYCGVLISDGGNPTLRRNSISLNSGKGIRVHGGGGGTFEDNDLRGNTKGAWYIAPDCKARVQRSGNIE